MKQPSLKFHEGAAQLQGFRPTSLSIFNNVDPDTLLREVIQNSLDAARSRSRDQRADIQFWLENVPRDDIPSIEDYSARFEAAVNTQTNLGSVKQAASIIDGIGEELSKETLPVLWVIDNGIGLSPNNMDRLLSDGQSEKGTADSTGSYGNGHMTMFPASNLRYLLYGGVFKTESHGEPSRIICGHTILASHEFDQESYGPHGYLVERLRSDFYSRFDYYSNPGFSRILDEKLDYVERQYGSGALVGIVGFNRFNLFDNDEEVLSTIERVAATHFTPAIYDGKMRVSIRSSAAPERVVTQQKLEGILAKDRNRKNRRPNSIGPSGSHAYQSLLSLSTNYQYVLETKAGTVNLHFRPLSTSKHDPTQTVGSTNVQLFRNGMWVANSVPNITRNEFSKSEPFSALILLEPNAAKRACELVRESEGPRHVDIDLKRMGNSSASKRIELNAFFIEIREYLKTHAPPLSGKEFDPGFLTLDIAGVDGVKSKKTAHPANDITSVPKRKPGGVAGNGKRRKGDGQPNEFLRLGESLKARTTAVRKSNGVHVQILPQESCERVELRLISDNGSDDTCDSPDPDDFIELTLGAALNGTPIRESAFRVDHEERIRSINLGAIDANAGETTLLLPIVDGVEHTAIQVDLIKRSRTSLPNDKSKG